MILLAILLAYRVQYYRYMSTTKTNKTEAYDYLTANHLQWGRQDATHIYVWELGYCVRTETEEVLMALGFHKLSEEFDRVCGKTMSVYKHK